MSSIRLRRTGDCPHSICVREKVGGVFFQPLQMTKDSEKANRLILDILAKAGACSGDADSV